MTPTQPAPIDTAKAVSLGAGIENMNTLSRTEAEAKQLRRELTDLRREMRQRGIKRTSCFNGGLSGDEYRYNARLFAIETKLGR